ncbi:MAG: tyrosine--tRNA ligase, partial [Bryobacteraceae bacterium]
EDVLKDGAIRVDNLLARIGLAESVIDALRKLKAGAVEINGVKCTALTWTDTSPELLIQVGKNWRKAIR